MFTRNDIVHMLGLRGQEQQDLFDTARRAREAHSGRQVIVRGVIEITNVCRVNCDYCPMRRGNTKENARYVMDEDTILDAARAINGSGINVVFLQGGEIPQTTTLVGRVAPRIRDVFANRVELLLCLGEKSRREYAYLKAQGANSYILKHETSDSSVHLAVRHAPLTARLDSLKALLDLGYKVGTGTIVGLPQQSMDSLADDILLAQELGTHMFSASPFVPAPNTPLADHPYGSVDTTLNIMAVARLINPAWLIPTVSALEKAGQGGQLRGLAAGANVVTVNFTPDILRSDYLIYGKNRFVVQSSYAQTMLRAAGLEPAGSSWVQ